MNANTGASLTPPSSPRMNSPSQITMATPAANGMNASQLMNQGSQSVTAQVSLKVQFRTQESLRLFDSLLYITRLKANITERRPYFNHPDLVKIEGVAARVAKPDFSNSATPPRKVITTMPLPLSYITDLNTSLTSATGGIVITKGDTPEDNNRRGTSSSTFSLLGKKDGSSKIEVMNTDSLQTFKERALQHSSSPLQQNFPHSQNGIRLPRGSYLMTQQQQQPTQQTSTYIKSAKTSMADQIEEQLAEDGKNMTSNSPEQSHSQQQQQQQQQQQFVFPNNLLAIGTIGGGSNSSGMNVAETKSSQFINVQEKQQVSATASNPLLPRSNEKAALQSSSGGGESEFDKESEIDFAKQYLQKGKMMVKYSENGLKPREKLVILDESARNLQWFAPGKMGDKNAKSIAIADILDIHTGRDSPGFKKFKKHLKPVSDERSFFIICKGGGRRLELEAADSQMRTVFLKQLQILVSQVPEPSLLKHTNHFKNG